MKIDNWQNHSRLSDDDIKAALDFSNHPDLHIKTLQVWDHGDEEAFDYLMDEFSNNMFATIRIIQGDWPWGSYKWSDRTLNLFVPKITPKHGLTPYLNVPITFNSIQEWLVMTVAHELMHARQHQIEHVGDENGFPSFLIRELEESAERHSLSVMTSWTSQAKVGSDEA